MKGVRIGDMGVEKDGSPDRTTRQASRFTRSLTVLAEGCSRLDLETARSRNSILRDGHDPPTFGLGYKELWQLAPGPRESRPHRARRRLAGRPKTYGGSFLYHLDGERVYVGYVVGLNYEDPRLKPFEAFQQFKHHPAVRKRCSRVARSSLRAHARSSPADGNPSRSSTCLARC